MASRGRSTPPASQEVKQKQGKKSKDISIVLLGSGGVGKSCLSIQYVRGVFVKEYHPTIEDIYRKPVELDGTVSTLTIVDTAGQDSFEGMREHYMKIGDAFIFTYSITDANSLPYARQLYAQLRRIRSTKTAGFPVCFLVGNKSDLGTTAQREVTSDEGLHFANSAGIKHFMESSAINSETVDNLFHAVIRQVRRSRGEEEVEMEGGVSQQQQVTRSLNPLDFVGGGDVDRAAAGPTINPSLESHTNQHEHDDRETDLTTTTTAVEDKEESPSRRGTGKGKKRQDNKNGRKKKWYEDIGCTML